MTAVEAEAGRLKEEADEPGWEVDPDDEWGVAVITTVGRQLKLRREAAGMRAAEFGRIVGYGEDMVYKIEGGKRIPRQEFLDKADEVLSAGGLIAAAWEDVKKVRYPKKVRALGKLEAKAVEIGLYECNSIHGLLQTPEHARALFEACQPPYSPDDVERMVTARMDRQSVFERDPAPAIHFVVEEAPLRREIGGHNGVASTARTPAGARAVVERHASGDADQERRPPGPGWQDRTAEVRRRYSRGTWRWSVQRSSRLRAPAAPDSRAAIQCHPGTGSHSPGVTGLPRTSAGRNMIRTASTEGAFDLVWFKSSYSSGTNGESCVELAVTPGTVHVRDSKDVMGPILAFAPDTWARFVPYASEA